MLAASGFLLVRLAPDVHGKPLFEDEAVVGQIAVHGVVSVVRTVIWDRGGAPLHFVLAHVVLTVDGLGRGAALALGGRRRRDRAGGLRPRAPRRRARDRRARGGRLRVVGPALGRRQLRPHVRASTRSPGALACDLFVRAAQRPTRASLALAAAGAWLLPATHPYGGILLAMEAVVALVAWRGRPPRVALPAIAIMASAAVFLIADVRLTERFDVGSHGRRAVATPSQALDQLTAAVRGFAGGASLLALLFALLAAVGLGWCARNERAFGALALLWLVAPPLLTLVARSPSVPSVKSEPRHLVSDLAAWAVLVALGSRAIASRLPSPGRLAVFGAVGVIALASPVRARDIRTDVPFWAQAAERRRSRPRGLGARPRAARDGILYPYSVVYLRTLGLAGRSTSLPARRGEPAARLVAAGALSRSRA